MDSFEETMLKAILEKVKKGIPLTPQEQEVYDYYKKNSQQNQNEEEGQKTK